MYEYADITAYKPDQDGTHLQIFIPHRNLEDAIPVSYTHLIAFRSVRLKRNRW